MEHDDILEDRENFMSPCCMASIYSVDEDGHVACSECESTMHYKYCIIEVSN